MKAARRRGVQTRLMRDADVPVVFLGYQKGAFSKLTDEAENLRDLELPSFRSDVLAPFAAAGEMWITLAKSHKFKDRDRVPVALWWAVYRQPHLIEPYPVWMPWATPRHKIEAALSFILVHRVEREIGIFGEPGQEAFLRRLAQYGVLRRIGKWEAYFANGDTAEVWRAC